MGGCGDPALPSQQQGDILTQGSPGTKQPGACPVLGGGGELGAPPSPCPQCPEGLACTFCSAHWPLPFSPVPLGLPSPQARSPASFVTTEQMCLCVGGGRGGQWEVSEPSLVGRAWRRKTWLEVTLGKGEKMRKGLPGAFASKDPSPAPSSQYLLCPPASSHPPFEEKRSQAAVSKPPPGLQEECLVLSGRETPGEREGESGGVQ